MSAKGSRYESSVPFSTRDGGFFGLRPRSIGEATPVIEYQIKEGDRLDLLALHFYNNDRKWWRILDANPQIYFGPDLSLENAVGETILIPALIEPGAGR